MMNYINFLREVRDNFFEVGAVWPSSRFLGRAFGAPLAHPRGPMHVLEVGAGNGAITHQIAAMLQPGDCLDVIEINGRLAHDLRLRLERDGLLDRPGIKIRLINADLLMHHYDAHYDYILSTLPFTCFPAAKTRAILQLLMDLLKPGGAFSYVKYLFWYRMNRLFGDAQKAGQINGSLSVINEFDAKFEFHSRIVMLNMPPARLQSLRRPLPSGG